MSRSNKSCREGYSVSRGHGGMKKNRHSATKAEVGMPQGPEKGSGLMRADARQASKAKAAPSQPEPSQPAASTSPEQGKAGWDQIGKAGASIVSTYKKNKAAKAAK